jgi:polar amino acid transport system permease protein
MELDFSPAFAGWRNLLSGALVTVEITAVALVLGCIMGLLVGIGRLNPARRVVYALCTSYVAAIRGTPLLVQLFILFFGLPQFGVMLPAFVCGVIGLGIYSGAYVSEIVRGAIQSIDRGQMEAARSVGMSYGTAMRNIILPQALVRMIPPLGNEFIALIKNSALVSLLTIHELMHEGQKIISVSYRSLEVYLVIAVMYFVLTGLTTLALRHASSSGCAPEAWCNEHAGTPSSLIYNPSSTSGDCASPSASTSCCTALILTSSPRRWWSSSAPAAPARAPSCAAATGWRHPTAAASRSAGACWPTPAACWTTRR